MLIKKNRFQKNVKRILNKKDLQIFKKLQRFLSTQHNSDF